MTDRTRGDLLADLADSINQLVEPRHVTEHVEQRVTDQHVTRSGKIRVRSRQMRTAHTVTLPGLVQALREAAEPGATEQAGSTGAAFESRPAAELEPLAVLRDITEEASTYARAFGALDKGKSLTKTLHALVGAHHTDEQLRNLTIDAARWVRRAKQATGEEAAPITLGDRCPYCGRRGLVVSGDLQTARCVRCGDSWSHDTIGLLADMLRANQERETMTTPVRCWMSDCTRTGPHEVHANHRGQTWTRDARCVDSEGIPVRELGA